MLLWWICVEYAVSPLKRLIASSSLLLDHNDIASSFGNGLYLQPTPDKNMIEPESTEHNWPKLGQQGKVDLPSPGRS
jgi:hypothetical protein